MSRLAMPISKARMPGGSRRGRARDPTRSYWARGTTRDRSSRGTPALSGSCRFPLPGSCPDGTRGSILGEGQSASEVVQCHPTARRLCGCCCLVARLLPHTRFICGVDGLAPIESRSVAAGRVESFFDYRSTSGGAIPSRSRVYRTRHLPGNGGSHADSCQPTGP